MPPRGGFKCGGAGSAELAADVTDDAPSSRELDVVKRVAEPTELTEETVKSDMKFIMNKLSASDCVHAVMIALKRGIIEG